MHGQLKLPACGQCDVAMMGAPRDIGHWTLCTQDVSHAKRASGWHDMCRQLSHPRALVLPCCRRCCWQRASVLS